MTFARDHGYEGPENSPGYRLAIDGAFLKEAKSLARSRRLRPALQAAADPCAYLKKLCELGWDRHDDVMDFLFLVGVCEGRDDTLVTEAGLHLVPKGEHADQ